MERPYVAQQQLLLQDADRLCVDLRLRHRPRLPFAGRFLLRHAASSDDQLQHGASRQFQGADRPDARTRQRQRAPAQHQSDSFKVHERPDPCRLRRADAPAIPARGHVHGQRLHRFHLHRLPGAGSCRQLLRFLRVPDVSRPNLAGKRRRERAQRDLARQAHDPQGQAHARHSGRHYPGLPGPFLWKGKPRVRRVQHPGKLHRRPARPHASRVVRDHAPHGSVRERRKRQRGPRHIRRLSKSVGCPQDAGPRKAQRDGLPGPLDQHDDAPAFADQRLALRHVHAVSGPHARNAFHRRHGRGDFDRADRALLPDHPALQRQTVSAGGGAAALRRHAGRRAGDRGARPLYGVFPDQEQHARHHRRQESAKRDARQL